MTQGVRGHHNKNYRVGESGEILGWSERVLQFLRSGVGTRGRSKEIQVESGKEQRKGVEGG